jgi:hypothetical protein
VLSLVSFVTNYDTTSPAGVRPFRCFGGVGQDQSLKSQRSLRTSAEDAERGSTNYLRDPPRPLGRFGGSFGRRAPGSERRVSSEFVVNPPDLLGDLGPEIAFLNSLLCSSA